MSDTLALKLNELKDKTGARQSQIADFVGVSARSVKNWLDGSGDMSTANFFKVCDFFQVSPEYFYPGRSDQPPQTRGKIELKTVNGSNFDVPQCTFLMDSPAWEPRIHEGDLLLIDEDQKRLLSGALYLFRKVCEGVPRYYVTRYFYEALSGLHRITDTNQNNGTAYTLDALQDIMEKHGLKVIGRVVGRCTADI